jgi:RNA polymerase sigma-70 factor (ECF subfamily)
MTAEVFKSTFIPLHPKLYRIAFALIENRVAAEDIVQDVFLKLWAMREQMENVASHEALAVTMVKNRAIDTLRTARRKEDIDTAVYVADKNPTPESQASTRNEIEAVMRIIDDLPYNQRIVLRLFSIKECSMAEIEELTGFSAVNIRVLLSRARKYIKEQYNILNNE